ncbi:MAG: histidine kinase [Bacteroidota bacterium]
MKPHFIHNPLFRLLSPLFSGILAYLLILLINNTVNQLSEQFLGEELYVCIGLAYLVHELSRLSFLGVERLGADWSPIVVLLSQTFATLIVSIGIVSISMHFYYTYQLGFSPDWYELAIFNSIYVGIAMLYLCLHTSLSYLYKINQKQLADELIRKNAIRADFQQFSRGINAQLLYESLESLLVLMPHQEDQAQALLDHLSRIYRYVLSGKNRELVSFQEELMALRELVALFNFLPYRKIHLEVPRPIESLVVPGTLLNLLEQVIRSTISSPEIHLFVKLIGEGERICFVYEPQEKLHTQLDMEAIRSIRESYSTYSDRSVEIQQKGTEKTLCIPQLLLHPEPHPSYSL